VPCMQCGRADDEESFVLCDGCPNGGHFHCMVRLYTLNPVDP
jgi:hypothetical protein